MKYFIIIIICLSFFSCSNKNTAENAVMIFHDAIKRTDINTAKTVAAPETVKFLESLQEVKDKLLANEESKAKFEESNAKKIKEYEAEGPYSCSCKDDGVNKKICEVKNKDGKVSMNNVKVELIENKWLVKISFF